MSGVKVTDQGLKVRQAYYGQKLLTVTQNNYAPA